MEANVCFKFKRGRVIHMMADRVEVLIPMTKIETRVLGLGRMINAAFLIKDARPTNETFRAICSNCGRILDVESGEVNCDCKKERKGHDDG